MPARGTSYSEAERKEKLKGYLPVPRDLWPAVQYGTHVRYVKIDGEFCVGGYVQWNPETIRVGDEDRQCLRLMSDFSRASPRHIDWVVAYDDIETLYARGEAVEMKLLQDLRRVAEVLNTNILSLDERVKKLERAVAERRA